jgi:hypothetical protein
VNGEGSLETNIIEAWKPLPGRLNDYRILFNSSIRGIFLQNPNSNKKYKENPNKKIKISCFAKGGFISRESATPRKE